LLLLVQEGFLKEAFNLAEIHKLDPKPVLEAWVRLTLTAQQKGRSAEGFLGVGLGLSSPFIRKWLEVHDAAPSLAHLTVTQAAQKRPQNGEQLNVKFHGQLVPNSLSTPNNKSTYECELTDTHTVLRVVGKGKPPRGLRDWLGVVVEGVRTTNNIVVADIIAPARTHEGYHEFVASKLLTYNKSLGLPQWLVGWFKDGRHDALLRIYVQSGRLEDAAKLAVEMINNTQQQPQPILPQFLLENLLEAIKTTAKNWDEKTKTKLFGLADDVKRAVGEFYLRNHDVAAK